MTPLGWGLAAAAWRGMAAIALWLIGCALVATALASEPRPYQLEHHVRFDPPAASAHVRWQLGRGGQRVKQLTLTIDPTRHLDLTADGELTVDGRTVTWRPDGAGSALKYRVLINRKHRGDGYDSRITADYALTRLDLLFPKARARTTRGAQSQSTIEFALPKGWTVETGYERVSPAVFRITNPERALDQPAGWLLAGELAVRRDYIGSTRVSVAAPAGVGQRRMELLALFTAAVPHFEDAFGPMPAKIVVFSGGTEMWRGGLSSPNGFYLHPERPLISENGTSTVLHELVHVHTRLRGQQAIDDWIAEGMAEYYAVELLHRAGLSTDERKAWTLQWLQRHGSKAQTLVSKRSSGPITARAVGVFAALDGEIRMATGDEQGLDDLVRALMADDRRVSLAELRVAAEQLIGAPAQSLSAQVLGIP